LTAGKAARAVFAAAALFITAGCDGGGPGPDGGGGHNSLAYSVYAGEDAAGSWSTFAFTKNEDNKDTLYYFPDNAACYEAEYLYDGGARSGGVNTVTARNPAATGRPQAAPGDFTVSADEKTITFRAYAGDGERAFKRVRGRGGNRDADEPPPSGLEPLTGTSSLDGTVWAATAYRTRDWTTLSVTSPGISAGTIDVSHSFDCTSFPRQYGVCSCETCQCDSCHGAACTCRDRNWDGAGDGPCGCLSYTYENESYLYYIGPFRVSGSEFTFLDFYGHGGTITLNRLR
jgi:hypothetical protein